MSRYSFTSTSHAYPWIAGAMEGALVMALELVAGHEIAISCGGGLQVWSLVIATTMAGLTIGYLLGAARKAGSNDRVWGMASIAVLWVSALSFIDVTQFLHHGLHFTRALITCMTLLMPPMIALGQILPLILKLNPAITPGRLFAISTWFGVGTAFLIGFILFRSFHPPKILFAAGLLATIFGLLFSKSIKNKLAHAMGMILLGITLFPMTKGKDAVWKAENLFGRVEVQDDSVANTRSLLFNRLPQTAIRLDDGCSVLQYVHQVSILGSVYPAGSRSLVLGLGGGTLYSSLRGLGHDVEACEWNPDIAQAAVEVFGAEESGIVVDDARHHIHHLEGMYRFIVLDCFFGESPPWHVLTVESIQELKQHLHPDGMMVVYFPRGIGENDEGTARMVNSLFACGFQVAAVGNPLGENPGCLYAASLKPFSYQDYPPFSLTSCAERMGHKLHIPFRNLSPDPSIGLFDDDHPILERLPRLSGRRL